MKPLLIALLLVTASLLAQTVPVSPTRQLQSGISVGMGIYAEPDATLQAQAVSVCAGTAGMTACIQANNAVATQAQARALAFMNDVYKNYPNANASLQANGLWFKGQ